jgi:serralysin
MPGFRDRFSRTDFFNIPEDSTQIMLSRAFDAFDKHTHALYVGDSIPLPPLPTAPALIGMDGHPADFTTTATLTVDAAWSQLDMASAGDSGLPDNYEPVESAWYVPGPTALIDVYTPNQSTTGTLVVDDANHVIAACDTPGDNDWFAVTLTAGVTYQFGQYAYAGGIPGMEGNGVPLADAYLEIYDSAGNLLSIADGGGPNTPSGLDALMTFEAPSSGTFYVNATSYDNDGDGVGDFAGDYEIFARTATGTTYTTHYDISSPLHSIDWGGVLVNREHVSVRNPDGMEGPRPTGEPAANPADVVGNSLGFPGKNVIYIYFAGEGDLYANADSTIPAQVTAQDPYQYEIQAVLTAAAEFAKVADIVYVSNYTLNPTTHLYERDPTIEYKPGPLGPETGVKYATGVDGDGFDADFFYWSYPGTPGPGISLLGSMSPPDYGDEGTAQFNSADERWTAQMLQQGGFSFVTLIHELGHGHGLAHPHDTGGGSSVMHGVQTNGVPGDDGGAGDFDLNQGVNTMMSYNDGWEKSPYGQADTVNEGYGWLGSLMALDIAVIQDKYGVNEDWATGNDTYVLKDVNEWGVYIDAATGQPAVHDASNQATTRDGYYVGQSTYYSCIWDAGGTDAISYVGSKNTTIDLRAATLQYEYGGAGWMSYATGIYGGFTIANGVTIENAVSGAGNDTLIGNDVANILFGGAGADNMAGGLGNDTYYVDNGLDVATEAAAAGNDRVAAAASYVLAAGSEIETLEAINLTDTNAMDLQGNEFGQAIIGNDGVNILRGDGGNDVLLGLGGGDYLVGGPGNDTMVGGLGNDTYYVDGPGDVLLEAAGQGADRVAAIGSVVLAAGQEIETLEAVNLTDTNAMDLQGNEFAQSIIGNDGVNILRGDGGNDTIVALGGNDYLVGGAGNDTLHGGLGDDTYYVDAGDAVVEAAGQGTDRVAAMASYTLSASAAIESLEAVNLSDTTSLNLTGNELGQSVIGNAGANVINGGGGNDTLVGLGGADFFAFTTALGAGNVDAIGDFQAGTDKFQLDDAVFTGLGLGALAAGAFVTGSAAGDADDRIIYNSATGQLFFDADGNGAGAAVQFATLASGLSLTASDFAVI